jgi:tetratricopeptide (TPR) repeat protein
LLAFASRPYEGAGALEAGIRLAESEGLNNIVGRGLLNLGVAYLGRDPRMSLDRSRAAYNLASRFGLRSTYATSLGNAGEAAVVLGEWDWALTATADVSVEHLEPTDRATILRAREEILAARGESIDALLAEHEQLIGEQSDSQQHSNLIAGSAIGAFAAGRYRDAADAWRRSAELNPTNVSSDLPRAARALLWAGDHAGVRSALVSFEAAEIHGRAVDINRRAIRAALTALDGDRDAAAQEYGAIVPELAEMGLEYERALVVVDMALVLGSEAPVVQAFATDARAIFERLGARPFSEKLEELLGEAVATRPPATSVPGHEAEAATA